MVGIQRVPKAVLLIKTYIWLLFVASCSAQTNEPQSPIVAFTPSVFPTSPSATPAPIATPTPQGFAVQKNLGPDHENFPEDYNPLTALQVEQPALLDIPAMLVSISHFPPSARPQAGMSFAPWVFEYYITEGATRFLSVFYGEYPIPEIPVSGNCAVRKVFFIQTKNLLGNRVWLDENKNGRQESYEPGIGGVCVDLLDSSGRHLSRTTTDSNGFFGFNVDAGNFWIKFNLPGSLEFTKPDIGEENSDSDADPLTGRVEATINASALYLDAGLILSESADPTSGDSSQLPTAEVGPIRSGRMIYADIGGFFRSSCLVYAFASPEVLEKIPQCVFVPHDESSGGAMMSLERMMTIAEDNQRLTPKDFDYSGNLFSEIPPEDGFPADQINVRVALLNQSGWTYDPLSESWLRFVDDSVMETAGQLHPAVDRLTGRQLKFDNVVVIFAEHEVISPTNLDIHLDLGGGNYAFLFRNGKKYNIRWSLLARSYEKETGRPRPLYFTDPQGNPVPLKPGNTWIFVATPYSQITDLGDGAWLVKYLAPEGAK